jgi:catechol 2,3-dioxygenase-like lactoylglutathione lyase family enzyme
MSDAAQTKITGVGTVGIHVADQDRALAFYQDALGFEVRRDMPFGDGGRWLEVAPPGAPTSIALMAAHDQVSVGIDTGIRLFTGDAEGDHAALVAHGADVDAEILRMGEYVPPMFTFRDPDGNTLYIVQGS